MSSRHLKADLVEFGLRMGSARLFQADGLVMAKARWPNVCEVDFTQWNGDVSMVTWRWSRRFMILSIPQLHSAANSPFASVYGCVLVTTSAVRQPPGGKNQRLDENDKKLTRLYCFKCTKFGHMIFRKIIKIIATRCQSLMLKCTKFDFDWGSTSYVAAGAYSALQTP